MTASAFEKITDIHDPRLDVYRSVKKTNLTRWSGQFIAEGQKVVERLLASRFKTHSVLLSERKVGLLPEGLNVPVYVVADDLAQQLVGYNFHAGFLACGERPSELSIDRLMNEQSSPLIVACPRITDPENLGTIIRIAAGFGATGILIGAQSCDPFSRPGCLYCERPQAGLRQSTSQPGERI